LGVSYAGTRYRLGGPFGPLDAHGTASAGQVSVRYPLARSAEGRRDLSLAYEVKTLRDWILGEETPARVQLLNAALR